MAADDNLSDQFRRGLRQQAEKMDPESRHMVETVARNVRAVPVTTPGAPPGGVRLTTGLGSGPIDATDADNIERARSAASRLKAWGLPAAPIGTEHPRGVSLDLSPNHSISLTPMSSGWGVDINHHDQYAEGRPEGWGRHRATLAVDEQDLPNALVEHLTDPSVRKAAALDE